MYTALKNPAQAKTQLDKLEEMANLAKNDSLTEVLLYTKANYYYTFNQSTQGDACFRKLINQYKEKKDYAKVSDCYKNLINIARKGNNAPLMEPTEYQVTNTIPFKIVYPSGLNYSTYRRFTNTLRIVTNIPALRMVASFSTQAIWYNYSKSNNPPMDPIGWIDTDLSYHEITADMLADENYKIKGVSLKSQRKNPKDNVPSKAPITWLMAGRLTKELGNIGGISFYANNILFYEPFLKNSTSNTLVQRNTGNFSFGVELFFNL